MKRFNYLIIFLLAASLFAGCSKQKPSVLSVDMAKEGAEIPKGLWGIFYEEISRAGDGGLYPEMIYNMGFEEKNIPSSTIFADGFIIAPQKPNYARGQISNFRYRFNADENSEGWILESKGASKAEMKITTDNPLNKATLHSLQIDISKNEGGVNLINEGFKGISVLNGEKYDLLFFLKTDKSYKGKVTASLISSNGNVISSSEYEVNNSGKWTNYTYTITSIITDNKAKLVMQFNSKGKIQVDFVSLLPQNTFMGRKNGLRKDIAQLLADLKPSFIRWPGGCIVEGFTMENRVNWKESIGERITRQGQFDLWGYHNTYNFGYHEFLQFCEDIGAVGMFVANSGVSCSVRNGDYYEMKDMETIVQDALDAVEYAIGDQSTKWGAERAKNGHPAPFPLKYVEIGNENSGPIYGERYNMIYKALKEKYPHLTYINTNGLRNQLPSYYDADKIEMIDPHYYNNPEFFYSNVHMYDTVPRGNYEVYIGEYACNSNVGTGNLDAALSEASFMTGIEHNSDLVKIASYAPLLENVNYRNWPTNLIRFKNDSVFGRSSYYVQKMYNENKPDVNLISTLDWVPPTENISGNVGFEAAAFAVNSTVMFKDFTVSKGSKALYTSDFPADTSKWKILSGNWELTGNAYSTKIPQQSPQNQAGQGGGQNRGRRTSAMILEDLIFEDCSISANIKRDSTFNGFSIRFGVSDDRNYFLLSVGSSRMQRGGGGGFGGPQDQNQPRTYIVSVNKVANGSNVRVGTIGKPFEFNIDGWHKIKLIVSGKLLECSIDDVSLGQIEYKRMQKQYAIAGFDRTNNEVVVKVVNGEGTPFNTTINLENAIEVNPVGQVITISSASNQDENSFAEPTKVSPRVSEYAEFSNSFKMEFKPYSFTILRIKAKKQNLTK